MQLPVLKELDAGREKIARDLAALITGPVHFDAHHRMLYSTDASLYQVQPLGVIFPADAAEVERILAYCAGAGLPVLPRSGGTSLAGQCTNAALVMDVSQMQRRILSVDAAARRCRVETGITVDAVNRHLAPSGLMFAADPATSAQAGVGGCIGNNAAGARSIKYGRTSENIAGVRLALSAGRRVWLAAGAGRIDPAALTLARGVMEIVTANVALIRERFPKTVRRNAGYGLDLILKQMDAGVAVEDLDLAGLICGSEGTLGVVVEAELKLQPVPKARGLAVLCFPSMEEAIAAVMAILATGPSAVELLDDVVLNAGLNNEECRGYVEMLPKMDGAIPRAVLYVEYEEDAALSGAANETAKPATCAERFENLRKMFPKSAMDVFLDGPRMAHAWTLRKSAEALLHGISATRKPHTFVEDNAVPVENLVRFVREFKQIVTRHGTTAAYYAHASVGVLHVRPLIDLHSEKDRAAMQAIAVEVAELARSCGGVMSGEHGDGRVRGPLLERFYGPELMQAFAQTKKVFDPAGIMNPGMIVGAGNVATITENLRIPPAAAAHRADQIDTFFNYDAQGGFAGAVEMCNGAGFCRTTTGGTMCPSYRATLEERHSTRGRANALRAAIMPPEGEPDFSDDATLKTLDLCLSCKACKTECPSNVDLARLKAEYVAQGYERGGVPLAARVFGNIRMLNRLGAAMPGVANAIGRWNMTRPILQKILGLAPERTLPAFSRSLYQMHQPQPVPSGPRVILFADCFTTYNESHIGLAAIRLLQAFGYRVELPPVGCCGRAMISTGLLAQARQTIETTHAQLAPFARDAGVKAILFLEPSCLSAIKDDWLELKMNVPLPERKALAEKSYLVEDFLDQAWDQHPKHPSFAAARGQMILHGHCHQKALWGDGTSSRFLRRIAGECVSILPSGCCGMAGSFGYMTTHYSVSIKIGELSVFGPVRAAGEKDLIIAPGTSCRHQIKDGTGRTAMHPVEAANAMLQ